MQQTPSNATALHNSKNQQDNTDSLHYDTGLSQGPTSGYVNYDDIKGNNYTSSETANATRNNSKHEPKMSINPKQHAPVTTSQNNAESTPKMSINPKRHAPVVTGQNNTENASNDTPKISINPKQHAPVTVDRDNEQVNKDSLEAKKLNTNNEQGQNNIQKKKPLNTEGDAHHIAEQPLKGMGGLTGKQPVGEVNFKKM